MTRPVLIVFAKAPQVGRVKTRLARDIGSIAAGWWYRHQLSRLIRDCARDPRWETRIAVSPDRCASDKAPWLQEVPRCPQGGGDLGRRMSRALATVRTRPVLIIGADIPDINPNRIREAFEALRSADAVIGPATDGGYWAIGLRRGGLARRPGFLDGVRWSGPHAGSDTVASMAGLRVSYAATLADVDTGKDLQRLNCRDVG